MEQGHVQHNEPYFATAECGAVERGVAGDFCDTEGFRPLFTSLIILFFIL